VNSGRRNSRGHLIPFLLAALLALVAAGAAQPVGAAPESAGQRHEVGYDRYSLTVDGRRVVLWAGEFHYFRLPSPDLWRDVLEKIKAAGFNGVSLYFHWGYHSPKPGAYDFTGVRDVDRLLGMAEELGLYVVARPGPYINAETTGGGLPAWLEQVPGRARSSAPGYTAAYRDWLGHIDPIIARHQVTRGGSVIAYNVENEYGANVDPLYMEQLQQKAREDGIDVPITHNNCCGGGLPNWSSGQGAVQIPGVDDYPQSFDCPNPDTTWGPWGDGITRRLRDDAPVYAAEYQAGAIDLADAGYEKCARLTGPDYMKVFYKSNVVGSGATMFNYYMAYGGTSWGWLPQPNDVYTSYDYGAAITEGRRLTPKYDEFKRQGYFVTSVAPLAKTDPSVPPVPADAAMGTQARTNPDTGTQFVLLRHADRADTADVSTTVDWSTSDGRYRVPVRIAGRDAKILVAGYDLGGQRLVWSTSEILTHAPIGGRDVAVLHGRAGEDGSTVLRYSSAPSVRVLDGQVRSSFDAATGDLRLDYRHTGLARVQVSGGGRPPLLLLLGTDEEAARFWRLDTRNGTVLVRGTELARSATVLGGTVRLRADVDRAGEVEVFGPDSARRLVVGDEPVRVTRTPSGSLLGRVTGPEPVALPALTDWRHHVDAPEAAPAFDDSRWTAADKTTTESPIKPKTLPVLYSGDYGFHHGNVWYRGHFTPTGAETAISVNAITGRRGVYLVWVNGRYVGSAAGGVQADSEPVNPDPGRGDFAIPAGLVERGKQATVSVLVENMGHNDDWTADDTRFKQPRGLFGAQLVGSGAPISWRVQGAAGGEDLTDPTRGPLNTGGLHGERAGWHLPGYPDRTWQRSGSSTDVPLPPGVSWHRTTFRLDLPKGHDVPIALRFADRGSANQRVLVFLNGWNVGQYLGDLAAQRDFALPAGLLHQHGINTLALAVIDTDGADAGPGGVSLVTTGATRGGVPVRDVRAPGFRDLHPWGGGG
jgi:beta-galactosidase GanA